ncbi:MAG TPA: primosomal protein N' [Usitatibacter sp.]
MKIARVAVDVPLEEAFDFEVPDELDPPVGALVVVPFGRTRKVGVVVERPAATEIEAARMKPLERVVDDVPPLGAPELRLLRFCAAYYQRGLGEVIAASLSPRLRQVNRRPLRAPELAAPDSPGEPVPEPTPAQREAIEACLPAGERFHPVLLHGVTGSGKTEVYLRVIERVLAAGRQALYLVPEIGLTPQLEERVRRRFAGVPIVSGHSQLGQGERASAWLAAQSGAARIVLGTRLAVLMPFRELGAIVVDEEHDPSYKQQEGLRYSARDVAVRRAQELGIPIVLGSATPSLESYANVREGRYALARLPERATGAAMPAVRTVDTRADRPREGLSFALVTALRECVARGEQGLVFVNRRGFSPVLYCRACSWHSACPRCSANLVLHLKAGELRCHHCGHRERRPGACPSCKAPELAPVGQGTQRVEEALREALPGVRIERVDRDAVGRKGALAGALERFRAGEVDILVGTQMLAKGHDYPRLTRVGVLDSDSALFSADFRSAERLFALLVQVAGRAGRAEARGEVLIQTDFPAHPLYAAVARHDYEGFADAALDERRIAGFPPYAHLALLRAEAKKAGEPMRFLRDAARLAQSLDAKIEVFDPVAAPLERKAGFERAQLLVRAATRAPLQAFLRAWRDRLGERAARSVRWSLDVDPQEV